MSVGHSSLAHAMPCRNWQVSEVGAAPRQVVLVQRVQLAGEEEEEEEARGPQERPLE